MPWDGVRTRRPRPQKPRSQFGQPGSHPIKFSSRAVGAARTHRETERDGAGRSGAGSRRGRRDPAPSFEPTPPTSQRWGDVLVQYARAAARCGWSQTSVPARCPLTSRGGIWSGCAAGSPAKDGGTEPGRRLLLAAWSIFSGMTALVFRLRRWARLAPRRVSLVATTAPGRARGRPARPRAMTFSRTGMMRGCRPRVPRSGRRRAGDSGAAGR